MALAEALGVQEDDFLGWVQDMSRRTTQLSVMPGFWGRCDVAVLPSDGSRETFGMAAPEATASDKPMIASYVGAIPEVEAVARWNARTVL